MAETMNTADLIEALTDKQAGVCAYGTREGDGRTCDCKYAMPGQPRRGEQTGCPELRSAIRMLRRLVEESGVPQPYQHAEHGPWTIDIYDRPARWSMGVVISKHGEVHTEFDCPSYRIWTLLAHWTDKLPQEEGADG